MFFILGKIYKGQSLLRVLMNLSFRNYRISGKVVDIGGGRSPDYFEYFRKSNAVSVEAVDGLLSKIDFEKDQLPCPTASADTVLLVNVLEHIYNHRWLMAEAFRILKPRGTLIGFVPFLIQYHPDPHDYFRYTRESLERIFSETGFEEIEIVAVGRGPFSVNFNNIVLSVPRFLRVALFPFYAILDGLLLRLRPKIGERYPLGYTFFLKK